MPGDLTASKARLAARRGRVATQSANSWATRRPGPALCGRCEQPAAGYASINGVRYCHPDDLAAPDCYSDTILERDGDRDRLDRIIGRVSA